MNRVFIGVGSNLGLREANINKAKILLRSKPGIHFRHSSELYETDPVDGPNQGKYLNAVWEIETQLEPRVLLQECHEIEKLLGRERKELNQPRTIDLDILFYGDQIIEESGLQIPHPRMRGRWFVLKPLWDLAADLIHPVFKKSICELLDECSANH